MTTVPTTELPPELAAKLTVREIAAAEQVVAFAGQMPNGAIVVGYWGNHSYHGYRFDYWANNPAKAYYVYSVDGGLTGSKKERIDARLGGDARLRTGHCRAIQGRAVVGTPGRTSSAAACDTLRSAQ